MTQACIQNFEIIRHEEKTETMITIKLDIGGRKAGWGFVERNAAVNLTPLEFNRRLYEMAIGVEMYARWVEEYPDIQDSNIGVYQKGLPARLYPPQKDNWLAVRGTFRNLKLLEKPV